MKFRILLVVLFLLSNFSMLFAATRYIRKPVVPAKNPSEVIKKIDSMLPVDGKIEGFELLRMLDSIVEPKYDRRKAEVLIAIYESQNTPENDKVPVVPGMHPVGFRVLQMRALTSLRKVPTDSSLDQVIPVLQSYLKFMNQKGPGHTRKTLQFSMALLLNAHMAEEDIQKLASEYLESKTIREWIKGRIASDLLKHQVENIKVEEDPDFTKRFDLILEQACLKTLDETVRASKRLGRSSGILSETIKGNSGKLLKYVNKRKNLTDSQKYFLAYSLLRREVDMRKNKKTFKSADSELLNKSLLWRTKLKGKTEKLKNSGNPLESFYKHWEKRKKNNK